MVMLEPLISLIVCSCLGGEAKRPGPDPLTGTAELKGTQGGGREVEKQKKRREGRKRASRRGGGRAGKTEV